MVASGSQSHDLLQERVALFGRIGAGVGAAAWLIRLIDALSAGIGAPTLDRSLVASAAAVAVLALSWLMCRTGNRSPRYVVVVESAAVLGASLLVAVMGASMPAGARPTLVVTLVLTLGLAARAVLVPSTPRRTLGLTLAAGVPVVLLAGWLATTASDRFAPGPVAVALLTAAAWWLLTVGLSTLISATLFGLRRAVDARRFGQYTLGAKLGEGGMGVVYRAEHATLRRTTALKLLPVRKAGEHALARFQREVRLTAQLRHPNSVTIFDYGHTADGIFYYAMELIDGLTLTKTVEEDGRMPAGRVIHILTQVAGSLAEAHHLGLVHRDVNPSNVMLSRQGGVDDMVKVLDFGLIKDVVQADHAQITKTNAFVGTPHFASPEAISDPSLVDDRSDLYEVGGVGYFLLTGSCVFDGAAPFILADHHLHTPPEPPSARIGGPVAEDLERLLLACLAKDPAERPASARRLQESLRACRDAGTWTPADATRWWDNRGAELLQEQHKAIGKDPANQDTRPL